MSEAKPIDLDVRWLGRVSYADGLALQDDLVAARAAGELADTLLLLEHEPVYTIGRTPDRSSLGTDPALLPHPLHEINRGGQATFHGPGQLVGYPILDLACYGKDLHKLVRAQEAALIAASQELGLVEVGTREGLTGVWCADRKLASIGVGVRKWISMHGFAINVGPDLSGFAAITPCGIGDVQMTSLSVELDRPVSLEEIRTPVAESLATALGDLRS